MAGYSGWPLKWRRTPVEEAQIGLLKEQDLHASASAFLAAHMFGVDWNDLFVTTTEARALLKVGQSTFGEWVDKGWLTPAVDKMVGKISASRLWWKAEVLYLRELRKADPPGRNGPLPWEPDEPEEWPAEWGKPWKAPAVELVDDPAAAE